MGVVVTLLCVAAVAGVLRSRALATRTAPATSTTTATTSSAPAASSTTPGLVLLRDVVRNTSFSMQTDDAVPDAGAFTFVTAAQARYHGGGGTGRRPVPRQQGPDLQVLDVEFTGTLELQPPPLADGSLPPVQQVQAHVSGSIDLTHLQGSITLEDTTNALTYQMVTTIPGGKMATVERVHRAVVAQDWTALYNELSSSLVGGMTPAQFSQQMTEQVRVAGIITAMRALGPPQVGANPAGMTYFTVPIEATRVVNGVAQTARGTATYLLEGSTWKLFSAPLG